MGPTVPRRITWITAAGDVVAMPSTHWRGVHAMVGLAPQLAGQQLVDRLIRRGWIRFLDDAGCIFMEIDPASVTPFAIDAASQLVRESGAASAIVEWRLAGGQEPPPRMPSGPPRSAGAACGARTVSTFAPLRARWLSGALRAAARRSGNPQFDASAVDGRRRSRRLPFDGSFQARANDAAFGLLARTGWEQASGGRSQALLDALKRTAERVFLIECPMGKDPAEWRFGGSTSFEGYPAERMVGLRLGDIPDPVYRNLTLAHYAKAMALGEPSRWSVGITIDRTVAGADGQAGRSYFYERVAFPFDGRDRKSRRLLVISADIA
ncbi:MAG: hypothetical protein JNK11_10400 [Alphaproteobacteria bacterium]|nr:hypothetical protein [Alphaproteobacteria bacterium]